VLGTFIYPLTNHPGHARERQALLAALADALGRPSFAGLQILLLHPESEAARARAAERRDDNVIGRLEEALATLRELIGRLAGDPVRRRIEVRLFSRTPPFALFQTDNFASLSFFYRDRPVSEVTRYEFFVDSPLGVFVKTTFDDLWRDERTIPLEDYPQRLPPLAGASLAGDRADGAGMPGRP
jgi:hypothetical protein